MTLKEEPRGSSFAHPHPLGHHRPVAPARLSRRVPELRRAGRVPLGGVAVRGLQLLPLDRRSRRRRAAQDRRERRALRRPHAAAARRRAASTRARRSRSSAGCSTATPKAPGTSGTRCSTSGPELQKSGWLREDNGRYVVAFDAPLTTPVPPPEQLRPGAPLTVNGQSWTRRLGRRRQADRRRRASCRSGPNLEHGFVVADLRIERAARSARSTTPTRRGRRGRSASSVALCEPGADRPARRRARRRSPAAPLQCPNCGAALEVKLATTQSIVCRSASR